MRPSPPCRRPLLPVPSARATAGVCLCGPTGADRRAQEAAAIPAAGVVVVRGEADGDGHLLLGDGTWSPSATASDLGVVHVVTEAYLIHPEHGALGIAAGEYRLRRQREHTPAGPRPLAD